MSLRSVFSISFYCSSIQDVTHVRRKLSRFSLRLSFDWLRLCSSHHLALKNNPWVVISSFHIAFSLLQLQNIMQLDVGNFHVQFKY